MALLGREEIVRKSKVKYPGVHAELPSPRQEDAGWGEGTRGPNVINPSQDQSDDVNARYLVMY